MKAQSELKRRNKVKPDLQQISDLPVCQGPLGEFIVLTEFQPYRKEQEQSSIPVCVHAYQLCLLSGIHGFIILLCKAATLRAKSVVEVESNVFAACSPHPQPLQKALYARESSHSLILYEVGQTLHVYMPVFQDLR